MFSPYYARARRRAAGAGADPHDHCAVNVALYGRRGGRWAMTERGRAGLRREPDRLQIGPSSLAWSGQSLQIDLDEVAVPWPRRLRGRVTVHAARRFDRAHALAPGHHWCPIAPAARVEVELGGQRWSGPGYLDANHGDAPLERAFERWEWSRAQLAGGDSVVWYDVQGRDAAPLHLGLRFDVRTGEIASIAPPPVQALPSSRWRVARHGRSDPGTRPRVLQTLTDAPFYARSVLEAQWLGERVTVLHESLSLARFDTPWVQAMLPFRMPRRAG